MKERIRQLRKALGLTQSELGERVGVTQSSIAAYENGIRSPTTPVIRTICREFNIREAWLLTGEDPMMTDQGVFSLDDFCKEHGATDLEVKLMQAYFSLDEQTRKKVMEFFSEIFPSTKEPMEPVETPEERMEREARAEAEEYYRLRLEEKRQIERDAREKAQAGLERSTENSKTSKTETA